MEVKNLPAVDSVIKRSVLQHENEHVFDYVSHFHSDSTLRCRVGQTAPYLLPASIAASVCRLCRSREIVATARVRPPRL
jgi:hypothetical protein